MRDLKKRKERAFQGGNIPPHFKFFIFSFLLSHQCREPPADLQPNHRGNELPGGPPSGAQGSRGAVSESLTSRKKARHRCVTERDLGRESDTPCHFSGFSVEQKALVPVKMDKEKVPAWCYIVKLTRNLRRPQCGFAVPLCVWIASA